MSRSFRSLVGAAALAFAVLFTTVGVGQYWFLHWQLYGETKRYLENGARDTRNHINFADTWDLQGYRRWADLPSPIVVIAQNGTLIDTVGYSQGMVSQVTLPFAPSYEHDYEHAIRFLSDVGEDWILYVHRLSDGGIVVLGARKETTPEGVNELLASNASRFGVNVGDALATPERAIHEAFDYAIIDKNGVLLSATGGIPLKTSSPAIPTKPIFDPARHIGEKTYAVFLDPIVSQYGSAVGLITVFYDATTDERVLHKSAVFNGIVAALLWAITVALSAGYLRRVRPSAISCAQIPFLDEGETVEFKSSLRWDYARQKPSKEIERAIVKTVVGFLNSENGGTLIIGVSDSKEILGLQPDYSSFKSVKPDRDGFEQALFQILIAAVGERRCARWVKTRFCSWHEEELCVVSVAPGREPVFLEEEGGAKLFVRVGNGTRAFGVQEALAYARDRWGGLALPRLHARKPESGPQ